MVAALPNGIGGSTGSQTAYSKPLYLSGNLYYVDSQTGTDASGYGSDRATPFATLAYALGGTPATIADGDIVVMLDGHRETISSGIALDDKISILGEGRSGGAPGVELTLGSASGDMFSVTYAARFENITFKPYSSTFTGTFIALTTGADSSIIEDCRFECSGDAGDAAVKVDALTGIRVKGCVFVSTATEIGSRPYPALYLDGTTVGMFIDGTTFDGGSYGWNIAGLQVAMIAPFSQSGIRVRNVKLLNGSDILLAANTTGFVAVAESTGSSKVTFS